MEKENNSLFGNKYLLTKILGYLTVNELRDTAQHIHPIFRHILLNSDILDSRCLACWYDHPSQRQHMESINGCMRLENYFELPRSKKARIK